jgi:hypothetical protein
MDPNTNLEQIRALVAERIEAGDELVELVEALDNWITRGGFLPRDWKK